MNPVVDIATAATSSPPPPVEDRGMNASLAAADGEAVPGGHAMKSALDDGGRAAARQDFLTQAVFSGDRRLLPHQVEQAIFAVERARSLNASETGTGKFLVALAMRLLIEHEAGHIVKCLYTCPKTALGQFEQEFSRSRLSDIRAAARERRHPRRRRHGAGRKLRNGRHPPRAVAQLVPIIGGAR